MPWCMELVVPESRDFSCRDNKSRANGKRGRDYGSLLVTYRSDQHGEP